VDWTFPNGEFRTFPHGLINQTLNMDCSGFVRMVYGRRMGIPKIGLDLSGSAPGIDGEVQALPLPRQGSRGRAARNLLNNPLQRRSKSLISDRDPELS
jgi:hypothetical protein